MKVFSRDFTVREIILLGILIVIVLGFLYYKVVDEPCRSALEAANSRTEDAEMYLTIAQTKLLKLQKMSAEMDRLAENGGDITIMESYNNVKNEISFLNDVLNAYASDYNISFNDVTLSGDQIRRPVSLQFTASDYDDACAVIEKLSNCQYRCLIQDVKMSTKQRSWYDYAGHGYTSYLYAITDENIDVTVTLTMTFYETMVGGTADQGLPSTN